MLWGRLMLLAGVDVVGRAEVAGSADIVWQAHVAWRVDPAGKCLCCRTG